MRLLLLTILLFYASQIIAQVPPDRSERGSYNGGYDVGIPEGAGTPDDGYREGFGIYREGNKYGLSKGRERQPAIYDLLLHANNGFIVKKDKRFAIANKEGVLKTSFEFDTVVYNHAVYQGAFLVSKNQKYGILNRDGDKVLATQYDSIVYYNPNNNYAIVKGENNLRYLLNVSSGKVLKQAFERIDLYKNLALIRLNGKMGVIKDDKMIVPAIYDSILHTFTYNDKKSRTSNVLPNNFATAQRLVFNLILKQEGKYGIVDSSGLIVYPCDNDEILFSGMSYDNNYYLIQKDKKFGIYMSSNKRKIPTIYSSIKQFRKGLIVANKDGKTGMFDGNAETIIPFEYDDISEYRDGNFVVTQAKKKGLFDKNGVQKIPVKYDELKDFYSFGFDKYILARQDSLYGVLTLDNVSVLPVKFAYVGTYNREFFQVSNSKETETMSLYNKAGKEVLPIAYTWIHKSNTENSALQILKKQDGHIAFSDSKFEKILDKNIVEYGYVEDEYKLLNPFNGTKQRFLYVKDEKGKFGILNEADASIAVPMIYDSIIQRFYDDKQTYFSVKLGKKYGLINGNNEIVIPIEYAAINLDFVRGDFEKKSGDDYSITVAKGKKWGLVDLNNKVKLPFKYQALQRLSYKPLFKAKSSNHFEIIDETGKIINAGPFDDVAFYEPESEWGLSRDRERTLTFYKGKMRVVDDKGKFLTEPVAMQIHNGFRSFDELKQALVEALDSKDDILLKAFVDKIAPSEHLLYYLKTNMLSKSPLDDVNIPYIKEQYFEVLKRFQVNYWNSTYPIYSKSSLTKVIDFTLHRDGWVTNERTTDNAFGDTKYLEKMLRNAFKVNGYWISSYFMSRYLGAR